MNIANNMNIQQIIDRLQESTICTQTQCFTTMEDAGFGQTVTTHLDFSVFAVMLACMMGYVLMNVPRMYNPAAKPQLHIVAHR
jgi:hypothetical protein